MPIVILSLAAILMQPPAPLAGAWHGTSLCLQGKPTCKDEQVVYHIASIAADSVTIQANKIVNGVEEEMGALRCGITAGASSGKCTSSGAANGNRSSARREKSTMPATRVVRT